MTNKTSSTREEILKMLKKQKRLTVTEMSKQLNITEMAVRRHLSTLERDQLVTTTLVRQAMGRPINIYELSSEGEELFPRSYRKLALEFIKDIEDVSGVEGVNQLFERRTERIKTNLTQKLKNKETLEEKVKELAQTQDQNGYMVEWEKRDDGTYVLKKFNCPISQVARNYNHACNCELLLYKEILGTDGIERVDCMGEGGESCDYRIKPAKV